jgi:DNA-binding NarL/FixJ family response regulator
MAGRHEPTTEDPRAGIRVFLCDDAATLRDLLRASLEWDEGFAVVGEAEDGAGLATAVRASAADVVVLDGCPPGGLRRG